MPVYDFSQIVLRLNTLEILIEDLAPVFLLESLYIFEVLLFPSKGEIFDGIPVGKFSDTVSHTAETGFSLFIRVWIDETLDIQNRRGELLYIVPKILNGRFSIFTDDKLDSVVFLNIALEIFHALGFILDPENKALTHGWLEYEG